MNAKRSSLKMSLLLATLVAAGCGTIPSGYTVVVENNEVVVWESFGQAKLAKLPEVHASPAAAVTTTWEFPGHPILGAWSAPDAVVEAPVRYGTMSRADIAFLRELARTDGDVSVDSVATPPEAAVASR
jgi:hypothetical protein